MSHQTVIVLDFGGQYNQLIARRVRECGVYCEVKPYTTPLEQIRAMEPIGIIFTGGPNSVYDPKSPQVDPAIFTWGVPILGICYGFQTMAHALGGTVGRTGTREYGHTEATVADGLVTLDSVAVIDYDAVWAAEHKDEFVAQFEANIASSENLE